MAAMTEEVEGRLFELIRHLYDCGINTPALAAAVAITYCDTWHHRHGCPDAEDAFIRGVQAALRGDHQ